MTPPVLTRPDELGALDLSRSAVIEASAGTGKTYLLEHLVLDLLIRNRATLEQILVVTFTERATAELVTRIRRKIDQALAATDPAAVQGWTLDQAARANLAAARRSFDRATIATIHSFCQRILTDEPLATRRLLGQTQIEARQLFGQAFRDVLRHTLTTDDGHRGYLEEVLAAGTGVDRLETLLFAAATGRGTWRQRYDEATLDRTLALLAALDLDAPGFDKASLKLGTRKSVRKYLEELKAAGLATSASGRRAAFLSHLDRNERLKVYFNKALQGNDLPEALRPFQEFARAICDGAPALEEAVAQRFLPVITAELGRRKLSEGLYDYDDMVNGVDQALAGPAGAALIAKLRARYRFALVDEAQDTEPAQWRIFKRVFLESDGPHPVVLIGDPKQAIYGFRGADVHTYLDACRDIAAHGGAPTVTLTRNYRATPEVITPLNAILEQQTFGASFFSEGDILYDRPVTATRPARGDGPGITLLRVDPPPPGPRKPRVGEIRAALRDAIAEEIVALRASAPELRLADIAVLTRSNADGREVAARLRREAIPSTLYRAEYLFETAEAEHLRAVLAALAAPDDATARMNAWLTPFFGMDLAGLAASTDPPADHPLLARLHRWAKLADVRAYVHLWPALLNESGLARRMRLSPAGQRALTNYRHLLDRLQALASERPLSVAELAATLASLGSGHRRTADTDDDTQRLETDTDAVRIMTIHAAKGLEAEVVFVYGGLTGQQRFKNVVNQLHDGVERRIVAGLPRSDEVIERVGLTRRQEERRLQYVAMTRARRRLYLPFFPVTELGEPEDKKELSDFDAFTVITGEYRHVNQRLRVLDADPARAGLFAIRPVRLSLEPGRRDAGANAPPVAAEPWTPPAALLAPPDEVTPDAAGLRARRRGFLITSYSRLKETGGPVGIPDDAGTFDDDLIYDDGAAGGADAVATGMLGPAEAIAPDGDSATFLVPDPTEAGTGARGVLPSGALPGGAASGLFLHGVLEKVTLGPLPPLTEWQRLPEVRTLIENELRRWDRDPRHFDEGAALVHAALTIPLQLPGGAPPLAGLSQAARVRREVGFLFPLPASAPGFVRGFLDVLFEHDGRVWFADWKSDVLASYDAGAVATRVREQYELQVKIYTLATARLLGIRTREEYERRFGGLVYLFLRGLAGGGGAGLHAERPTFDDLQRWENELAELPLPGSRVLNIEERL